MNFPSFRRLIYLLLLLTIAATFAIVLLIRQLDLDGYRQTLEEELSVALQQPVTIGRSSLAFKNGIALELRDLRIGPETALLAEIPRLTATLKIAPLFEKKLILNQVQVENPNFQLWLPFHTRPGRGTTHDVADALGIQILTINNASLKIHLRRKGESRQLVGLHSLHAVLQGWGSSETGQLAISGQVQQKTTPADFVFTVSLPSAPDPDTWRLEELSYQFDIYNFATAKLPRAIAGRLPERINGSLSFRGIPASGTALDVSITDQQTADKLISLTGLWNSSADRETFSKLQGKILGLPLSGNFELLRQKNRQRLAGRFGVSNFQLTPRLLKNWKIEGAEQLLSGELDQLVLTLEKDWPKDKPLTSMPRIGAELTLCNLVWGDQKKRKLQDLSVALSLKDDKLKIADGLIIFAGQVAEFSGRIDSPFHRPQVRLAYQLTSQLKRLGQTFQMPDSWQVSGPASVSGRLNGPLRNPDFSLKADLTKAKLSLGMILDKKIAQPAVLKLQGTIKKNQLQLDKIQLNLAGTSITGHGYLPYNLKTEPFLLDFGSINLGGLQPYSPILKKIRTKGNIHPVLERQQSEYQATIELAEVGAHFFDIIGDLRKTSGTLRLDRHGFAFKKLRATLGQSDFILDGKLRDWKNPQLNLTLHSDKVRAQDLIFPNRQLNLYDLDGKLQINRDGISFAPVKVRLETDTLATVTGEVSNFDDPQTILEIVSEKANILEVINLFSGPRTARRTDGKTEWKPLIIQVTAKQGTLGGLRFQNARGTIVDHKGVLTIYPLTFENGAGFCMTRVEFDRNHEHGILKVSGHAENINASILHQDLFEKQGLIDGKLRGDFYIEGIPYNDQFWHTAIGGIYLQIKEGTLRKFHGLAKVFSLLNVSQLIAGKLPDMNTDGMPFTLMEGSLRILDGRARTEDMRVNSEAMNLSIIGDQSLVDSRIDFNLGVMPLRTVDKVITSIPIAGWILAGDNKALLTAHFKIEGTSDNPKVTPVPIGSVSNTVFGIVKRTFGLPGKLVKDLGSLFKAKPEKKKEPTEETAP